MKIKYLLSVAIVFCTVALASAQTQKIGHLDMAYVMSAMPEYKQVESTLKTLESQLMKQAQAKQQDLQVKYDDYMQNGQTMAEAIRLDKEKELNTLQQSIQEFGANAQKTLEDKSQELMQPLYKKIGDAIETVSKEGGYSYIMNVGIPTLDILYYSDPAYDVSNDVLKKMGVVPPTK